MRRWLGIATLGVGLVLTFPAPAQGAEAATITAVGWWSQRPGATELPGGGFEVALLPNAPQSVAALRVDVKAAPLTTALLELREAEQVLGDVASIQACPTNDGWKPANLGAWADAPTADCEASSVTLGRNADATWTADVGSLLSGGSTSLMVVPLLEVSDAQQSAAFQVTFAGARLVAPEPEGPTSAAAEPTPGATFAPANPVGPAAGLGVSPEAPATTTPAASPSPVPTSTADTSLAAPKEDAGPAKPWWRLAFGIPLSIAAGGAAVFVRGRLREREILGG